MENDLMPIQPNPPVPWKLDPGTKHDPSALFNWWRRHSGFNSYSVIEKDIDLYGDLVLRHISKEFIAIRFQTSGDWVELTYHELDIEITKLHAQWAQVSLTAGDLVVIISRNPLTRIIGTLAAFRAGLVASVLVPSGTGRTIHEIRWLDPNFIHADRDITFELPIDLKDKVLPHEVPVQPNPAPIGRQSINAPILRLLSPYSPGTSDIQVISAGSLFINLLRDSLLVLGLERSSHIATFCGYGPPSPFIELCSLFSGCQYSGLNPDTSLQSKEEILNQSFDVIHLPQKLATQWSDTPIKNAPNWKRWFRDALEAQDILGWTRIVNSLKLQDMETAVLHWSLQTGSVVLGTSWRYNPYDLNISPAAGINWHLGDLQSPETESKLGYGLFCQRIGEDENTLPSPLMMARIDQSLRLIGTYPKGRFGIPFPSEIVKKVLAMERCWHVIVEQEASAGGSDGQFVLLAFMDPRPATEIQLILERQVGMDGVPNEIRCLPLVPRFDDTGGIDEPWIRRVFLNGKLEKHAVSPVYLALSAFKLAILATVPPQIEATSTPTTTNTSES